MDNNYEYNIEATYLLHMIASVINGTKCPNPPVELNWTNVLKLAHLHSVEVLLYYAVQKLDKDKQPDSELMQKLVKRYRIGIGADTAQSIDANMIFSVLENEKIDSAIVKGYFTKTFYPSPEMREMCDLDFLLRRYEDRKRVDDIMVNKLGYTMFGEEEGFHGEYKKPPFMFVDFTDCLIPKSYPSHKYFSDIWDRVERVEGYEHIYKMRLDDFYIYMLAHTAKHYINGGIGLRYILDFYVFYGKNRDIAESPDVINTLKNLNLLDFHGNIVRLSREWFSSAENEINNDDVFEHIMRCGVYGKKEVVAANSYLKNKGGVFGFFIKKMFPTMSYMREIFPFLNKLPFLLPIMWVVNWFRVLLLHPKKISKTVNASTGFDKTEIERVKQINQKMGIALNDSGK